MHDSCVLQSGAICSLPGHMLTDRCSYLDTSSSSLAGLEMAVALHRDAEGGWSGFWHYNPDLFLPGTVERMAGESACTHASNWHAGGGTRK